MLGFTPLKTGAFVAVDIETTGSRPGCDGIIEIGAVRVDQGCVCSEFSTFVRPSEAIPLTIRHLTGIDDAMVADAPAIADAIAAFREFAEGAVLVAHNHRFDIGFLDYEAECVCGHPFPRPVLDTLCLSRRLHPEISRHNLRELSEYYGTPSRPEHRALPDARATAEILLRMFDELEVEGVYTAAEAADYCGVARQGALARKLPLATHLSDSPGLYLFRDANGHVVYLGRAKSIRSRVRSHFYAPGEPGAPRPATEAVRVDHIPCVSPLDALLLESRMLDRYSPRFNREQHRAKEPLYLHLDTRSDYPRFRVTRRRMRSGVLLGPVSNQWAASTLVDALAHHFDLRLCGRPSAQCEEALGPRCATCAMSTNPVPAEEYRERVLEALAVFNGGGPRFRDRLNAARESAVADQRYVEAAVHRDAQRALDRTLAALAVVGRASDQRLMVIVEGDEHHAVAHVITNGWLFTTLRFTREQIARGAHTPAIVRALSRGSGRIASQQRISARRLRDMGIIDAYRKEHVPLTFVARGEPTATAARVSAAMRRLTRVPRKHHAAISGV